MRMAFTTAAAAAALALSAPAMADLRDDLAQTAFVTTDRKAALAQVNDAIKASDGLLAAKPGDRDFDASKVLQLTKAPIKGPHMPITVVVDKLPAWVGIDPYNKRIDRNSDDNLVKVELK